MEEYAKLLNLILTKVVFNHMTMFFVFLFIGFTFIPSELTLYLNAKTPAFFPDWFTLANFGSLVFALVATMLWILFSNASKFLFIKLCKLFKERSERNRLLKLLDNLSDIEQRIIAMSCIGESISFSEPEIRITIEKLIELDLISYGWVSGQYEVNPLIRSIVITELNRKIHPHH